MEAITYARFWWSKLVSKQDLKTIFEEDPELLLEDMAEYVDHNLIDHFKRLPSGDTDVMPPIKPEPPENVRIFSI